MELCKDKPLKEPINNADRKQLKLYIEGKLSPEEEDRIDNLLLNHVEWREADMEVFEELENKKKLQPANNLDYKSTLLKRLGGVAVMFLILLVPVEIEKLNAPVFKGITEEKNIIEEAIEYWEERFNRWFGENK